MEGRLLLSTTSLGLWRLGSAQLLKPLLSPRWTHMSPCHWILYSVSMYININIYIYIYKLCTKGMSHCCGGCCPYVCGLSLLVCLSDVNF